MDKFGDGKVWFSGGKARKKLEKRKSVRVKAPHYYGLLSCRGEVTERSEDEVKVRGDTTFRPDFFINR